MQRYTERLTREAVKAKDDAKAAEERAAQAEARAAKAEQDAARANAAAKSAAERTLQTKREAKIAAAWEEAQKAARLQRLASQQSPSNNASEVAAPDAAVPDNDEWSDITPAEALTSVPRPVDANNLEALVALSSSVVKVGNDNSFTWGQTTVTLNFDRLASIKKESVVARLNYFYSFPSLATGKQKTIPLTAFRNAQGRSFDPSQYGIQRVYIDARTPNGPKNWDARLR